MLSLDKVQTNQFTVYNHFPIEEVFKDQDSLTFAFGISSFLVNDPAEDQNPDYGQIKIYMEKWDSKTDEFIALKQRKCEKYTDFGFQVTKRDHAPFFEVPS